MTEENTNNTGNTETVGRNEPCPCGSGKKYKRCCGVGASPKLSTPKASPFPTSLPEGFDPNMMAQVSQALQRLPKGQLQRLQGIIQKAMSGKDVSQESAEFEKTLPLEFQEMLRNMPIPNMNPNTPASQGTETPDPGAEMTEEQARAIVEAAASEGKISKDQATELLQEGPEQKSKFGKFWKSFSKK